MRLAINQIVHLQGVPYRVLKNLSPRNFWLRSLAQPYSDLILRVYLWPDLLKGSPDNKTNLLDVVSAFSKQRGLIQTAKEFNGFLPVTGLVKPKAFFVSKDRIWRDCWPNDFKYAAPFILLRPHDIDLRSYHKGMKRGLYRPFSYREKIFILLKLARKVSYLHQQGKVHRDIRPSNIFLNFRTGELQVHLGVPDLAKFLPSYFNEMIYKLNYHGGKMPLWYIEAQKFGSNDWGHHEDRVPEADFKEDLYSFWRIAYDVLTDNTDFPEHREEWPSLGIMHQAVLGLIDYCSGDESQYNNIGIICGILEKEWKRLEGKVNILLLR